jgi:tetratricopeptide (TPR) repeat protein
VTDAAGKPVVDAKVTIEFVMSGRKFESKTDKNGEYGQIGLIQGGYRVTVEKDNLKVQRQVMLRGGVRNTFNITLAAGGGGGDEAADPRIAQLQKLFTDGNAAEKAGDFDGAIAKFNEALTINPNCSDCWVNIGNANIGKKDFTAAEDSFKKAIGIKPDSSEAYLGLAGVYNAQRKFDEANEASKKASELAAASPGGSSPEAMFNQGVILWNGGKIADAKKQFQAVIAAKPDFAEAHYQLGMALVNEGDLKGAASEFETYLKLAPNGPNAAQAKAIAAQLPK